MKIISLTAKPDYTAENIAALEQFGTFENRDKMVSLSMDKTLEIVGDADIMIAGTSGIAKINEPLLEGMKNLKMISLLTVGVSHVDLDAAAKRNIKISTIAGANAESVAEHTWGMILDLAKKIHEFSNAAQFEGVYEFRGFKGLEVYGKTIGIIGLGNIGRRVARIAKGFDMEILGYNRSPENIEGVKQVELEELLRESDVIVTAVPLSDETKGMIGDKEVAMMKQNVIVVNPAREEIVDREAIFKGVKEGKIFGYGVETEINMPVDKSYYEFKNILATPHNAFYTAEADRKSFDLAVENVVKFLEGHPQNLVN